MVNEVLATGMRKTYMVLVPIVHGNKAVNSSSFLNRARLRAIVAMLPIFGHV
jgi:hypothetical protein